MTLVDTHAHLYWDSFKEGFDDVIKRAQDAGVNIIINVGVNVELSKKALEQVRQFHGERSRTIEFYSTIGIHPHEAVKYLNDKLEKDITRLEDIYKSAPDKIVAVGECGLDYLDIDEKTKQLQRQLFQSQIDLAKKLNLPLIVHCRDDRSKNSQNSECWDEVIEMTKDWNGIYHCYSGLPQTTNYILQTTRSARGVRRANFLISFAGNITYPKNEYLRDAAKLIPSDRIVIETDCPFLPPQSKRGQRNEPANVLEIAQIIAEIKGLSFEKIANQTTMNVKRLLKLS